MHFQQSIEAFRKSNVSLLWILGCLSVVLWPAFAAQAQSGVAYIANTTDNTVSVISVADQTFQLTIAVGSKPTGVASNSTYAYVANSGDNTVSVINTGNNTVVQTLAVGSSPVAIAANDNFAYVVNAGNGTTNGTVSVINASTNTLVGNPITVGKKPSAVAIAPAPNGNVYVTNSADATVSVISSNAVIQTVALTTNGQNGVAPTGITVGDNSVVSTGNFQFAYVTDPGAAGGVGGIWILDLPSSPSGTVTVDSFDQSLTGDTGVAGAAANDISQTLLAANSTSMNPATVAQFDYSQETPGTPPIFVGDVLLTSDFGSATQPEQLAFTNDGGNAVVTAPGTSNAGLMSGFSSGSTTTGFLSNTLTTGNGPSGVSVTPNDPNVCAFNSIAVAGSSPIYSCSGTGVCNPLPSVIVVPSGAQLNTSITCESSVPATSVSTMNLTFDSGSNLCDPSTGVLCCTISGGSDQGNQCSSQGNLIGGGTVFPPSGVFTIQASGQAGNNSGAGSVRTEVGTNCQLSVSPTTVQVNHPVSASLICTAPSNDNLSGTIQWGDGTKATVNGTGNDITPVSLTLPGGVLPTHSYSAASPLGGYPVSATVTDKTENASGSVTPASVAVTVTTTAVPPMCTFTLSDTTVQVGINITGMLSCSATAGDSLSGTLNWGDGASSTVPATAASNGPTNIPFGPHSYATAGTVTASATLTDTTSDLAGTITPPSIQVTVTSTPPLPKLTPGSTNVPVAAGQSAVVSVQFTGGPPNVTFSLSCQGLPQGANCSFNPSPLTLNSAGSGTVQVTVTTAGASASLVPPVTERLLAPLYAALIGVCGFVFVCAEKSRWPKGKLRTRLLLCAIVILLPVFGSSCGTSVSKTNTVCSTCTPSGTYSITVVATSTQPVLKATTVFTLTVGP